MSLIKLNNRAVKDVTEFGSISSLGSLTHISTATASASASIEFTSGIDSTYKEYVFYIYDIHPSNNSVHFEFNGSTDGGSNYNVTKTSSFFDAYHYENDTATGLNYNGNYDLAQSTNYQRFNADDFLGDDADQSLVATLRLFNPSSTTYVKHFIGTGQFSSDQQISINTYFAGYFNTTSAINSLAFRMSSGNIDAGQILLFGVN